MKDSSENHQRKTIQQESVLYEVERSDRFVKEPIGKKKRLNVWRRCLTVVLE